MIFIAFNDAFAYFWMQRVFNLIKLRIYIFTNFFLQHQLQMDIPGFLNNIIQLLVFEIQHWIDVTVHHVPLFSFNLFLIKLIDLIVVKWSKIVLLAFVYKWVLRSWLSIVWWINLQDLLLHGLMPIFECKLSIVLLLI